MQDRHPTIKVIKTLNISNFTVKIHQKSLQNWKNVDQFNDKIVNLGCTYYPTFVPPSANVG